jgi:hypothetical protein
MKIYNYILYVLCFILLLTSGCASTLKTEEAAIKEKEILTVYPDGSMVFKDRTMNEEDVIIYPDGRGGERAAVKLRVPLYRKNRFAVDRSPYFYRDTIIVERKPLANQDKDVSY